MSDQFAQLNDIKIEQFREMLSEDPLYQSIKGTSLEDIFFGEDYLYQLEEKLWYSTPEIAEWFGINDGQIRYYIKPFHDYLFEDDTPTSSTAYRLNLNSILKLRLILLLKDKYRVKGLQKLLGLDGEGYIQSKRVNTQSKDIAIPSNVEKELETLKAMFGQLLNTGMFELKQGETGPEISLKQDFLNSQLNNLLMASDQTAAVKEIQEQTDEISKGHDEIKQVLQKNAVEYSEIKTSLEQTAEENRKLKETIQKLEESKNSDKDVVLRIKEQRIVEEVRNELRFEAIKKWTETSKPSVLTKLFQSGRLETEKEEYVRNYIKEHLNDRLEKALLEYSKGN